MADILEKAEFWLPSDFLSDELCFPDEFPYDFDSVFGSSDEEDLQPIPSQHGFENNRVISGSPQSTLVQLGSLWGRSPGSSNGGSPNGPSLASSPRTTTLATNSDAVDVIYRAAGQVAKLKLNSRDNNRNLLFPDHHHRSSLNNPISALYRPYQHPMVQNRGCISSPQYYQHHQSNQQLGSATRGVYLGGNVSGGGVKKQCAGTGVFLPRCYDANPANSRKKPGCSPAHLPARVAESCVRSQSHPRFNGGNTADLVSAEVLMARRHAMLMQGRRNSRLDGGLGYELRLPQEWTY